jgi:glycosyltransferase involved in cell wall biosynthesis
MFFSVIIPTYNRPERVLIALKSVLNQTFQDFEIVLINDGSTVGYKSVEDFVKHYPQINYILQTNQYLSAARNTGLKNAKGKFICFLDDDDEFLANHLQVLYDSIKQNKEEVALYHTRTFIRYEDGKLIKIEEAKKNYINEIDKILSDRFPPIAVCIHNEIANQIKFDVSLKYAEDLDYWIQVAIKWPIKKINEYTIILPHETDNKMSDFKLPNQYNHLLAYEKFKREYGKFLSKHYLNERLIYLYRSCASLFANTKQKEMTFYSYSNWLKLEPQSFFTRQSLSILVKLLWK